MPDGQNLIPKGLRAEALSIRRGRVDISVAPVARSAQCPVCGRPSRRVHSILQDRRPGLAWRPRRLPRPGAPLLLRRALLRAWHLLRAAARGGGPRPQKRAPGGGVASGRVQTRRQGGRQAGRGTRPRGRSRRPAPKGEGRVATRPREGEGARRGRLRLQEGPRLRDGAGGPRTPQGRGPFARTLPGDARGLVEVGTRR